MKFWVKTFIALGLGALSGLIAPEFGNAIKPIGSAFLGLLSMLIVPLVFSSMTTGITNIPDTRKLGKIGATTLFLYVVTTLAAISIGIGYSMLFSVGSNVGLVAETAIAPAQNLNVSDVLLSLIPKNPIKAFAEQNVVQVIIFSILFGAALNAAGKAAKSVVEVLESLASIMQRMTLLIMSLTPIGVFALMAYATANMGAHVLLPVVGFLLLYYLACLTHFVVILCGLIRSVGLNPKFFIQSMRELFATAVSTCSSSACLPVSLTCSIEKLGISKSLASFVLPLGCSLNMNGSALFQTMGAIFIAQCYGIDLSLQQLATMVVTVLLATIGTASIPGAGFIMLSIVFSSIGIPMEGLALLAGVDRLRDMGTTSLNVVGDVTCALFVAAREGALDINVYTGQITQEESSDHSLSIGELS